MAIIAMRAPSCQDHSVTPIISALEPSWMRSAATDPAHIVDNDVPRPAGTRVGQSHRVIAARLPPEVAIFPTVKREDIVLLPVREVSIAVEGLRQSQREVVRQVNTLELTRDGVIQWRVVPGERESQRSLLKQLNVVNRPACTWGGTEVDIQVLLISDGRLSYLAGPEPSQQQPPADAHQRGYDQTPAPRFPL